jgi:hypothetical protein
VFVVSRNAIASLCRHRNLASKTWSAALCRTQPEQDLANNPTGHKRGQQLDRETGQKKRTGAANKLVHTAFPGILNNRAAGNTCQPGQAGRHIKPGRQAQLNNPNFCTSRGAKKERVTDNLALTGLCIFNRAERNQSGRKACGLHFWIGHTCDTSGLGLRIKSGIHYQTPGCVDFRVGLSPRSFRSA